MNFVINNQEIFKTNSSIHNINTRNKHHLHRPHVTLVFKKYSLCWYNNFQVPHLVWQFSRMTKQNLKHSFIHSFIPLVCAEFDDSLPFSGASSIPLCYVIFPATLPLWLFFHRLSPHIAIYFLVYLSILLFPNSYIILFWEFCFLPFSEHVQTNVIYLTVLSLL